MSISKTRQKLVDVARQLFAKKGINGTTMNDIALASGKGRRTLYTYFNCKEDIYYAVIESELERLSDKLDAVAAKRIPPQDKVIELIYTHLTSTWTTWAICSGKTANKYPLRSTAWSKRGCSRAYAGKS